MTTTTQRPTRLGSAHLRYSLRETLRTPAIVWSAATYPVAIFALFYLPFTANIPAGRVTEAALTQVAQLGLMGVVSVFLFTYGIGIADERTKDWSRVMRSLPVGPWPPLRARIVTATCVVLISVLPLFALAALTSPAFEPFLSGDLAWWRLMALVPAWIAAALPFLFGGLLIGYLASPKTAVALTQVVFLPAVAVGGLLLPPASFPGWLDVISRMTPARPARDLVMALVEGSTVDPFAWLVWLAWLVGLAALTIWAQRRDEGRRFG